MRRFVERARDVTYPSGRGWVGGTWQSGQPQWVADVSQYDQLVQKNMVRDTGLHASFAFPGDVGRGGDRGFFPSPAGTSASPMRSARDGGLDREPGRPVPAPQRSEESLRRFRTAIDVSADIVFLVDPVTLRYVDANDAASRALGYSHAELVGDGDPWTSSPRRASSS